MPIKQRDWQLAKHIMDGARALLNWAEQELLESSADPALDALILLSEVTGLSRTHVLFREKFEAEEERTFRQWISRRKSGEPIQYITGRAYFRNLTLEVGPGVLIPRPESEEIVGAVVSAIKEVATPYVLDLGAGSGALALSIATEVPHAKVVAVEKEPSALKWLEKNIAHLATSVRINVEVHSSDVADFDGRHTLDAVIANPPYIPDGADLPNEVALFEPHVALFGGTSGLSVPELFIQSAERALKPGGFFAIEHHESQGDAIASALTPFFTQVNLHYDFNDRPRWSSGVRK